MILEVVKVKVLAGKSADFESGLVASFPLFAAAPGCHGMQVLRSVEQPDVYYCLVKWETVADHVAKFQKSPAYERLLTLIGGSIAGHFEATHCNYVNKTGLTAAEAGASWMKHV